MPGSGEEGIDARRLLPGVLAVERRQLGEKFRILESAEPAPEPSSPNRLLLLSLGAIIGLALAATGKINIWLAPFLYAAGYVLVIFNSLRLVRFGEEFTEAEDARRRHEANRPVKPVRSRFAEGATAGA